MAEDGVEEDGVEEVGVLCVHDAGLDGVRVVLVLRLNRIVPKQFVVL